MANRFFNINCLTGIALYLHMLTNFVVSVLYGSWTWLVVHHFILMPLLIAFALSMIVIIERKNTELIQRFKEVCNWNGLLILILIWPSFAFHIIHMDIVEDNQSCTFD